MSIYGNYNFFKWDYWFGQVDSRPLGIFRICFALLMIKVALYYLLVADKFFSDSGVTPRSLMLQMSHDNRISILDFLPETWMAQTFFIVWIGILILLLVGYKTHIMLILNFIFIISTHARNYLIFNGADVVMRLLSFWILFIPLGHAYSLDWYFRQKKSKNLFPLKVYALPLRLIQIQIAITYLFAFLLKLDGKPWRDGTALFYALQSEAYVLPTGQWIFEHAPMWFFTVGTYFTLFVEGGFLLFVFLPIFQPKLRAFILGMGVLLHMGIALLMSIHDFSLIMIISYLLFADISWFKRVEPKVNYAPHENKLTGWKMLIRFGTSLALILAMVGILWWNLATIKVNKQAIVAPMLGVPKSIMQYLGLGQSWSMFAPYPPTQIGWMTVAGQFADGTEMDLMTEKPLSDKMTQYYWGPDLRWKKYSAEVWETGSEALLQAWGEYYCRRYNNPTNSSPTKQLVTLEIIYNWRWVHSPGKAVNPLVHTSLRQHPCRI